MSSRPNPAADAPSSDWTSQAADTIEAAVSLVRDRATVPVRTAARAAVYGIALAMVAVVAAVLAGIAGVRILVAYLPAGTDPQGQPRVWVAYLVIGGILSVVGVLLLRKAESRAREDN